jgi:hypothetical protein
MAARGQTHAKRNREVALKERRERKRAKKADAAAQRAAGNALAADSGTGAPEADGQSEAAAAEWIQ